MQQSAYESAQEIEQQIELSLRGQQLSAANPRWRASDNNNIIASSQRLAAAAVPSSSVRGGGLTDSNNASLSQGYGTDRPFRGREENSEFEDDEDDLESHQQ